MVTTLLWASNSWGCATSSVITLTVSQRPFLEILTPPTSQLAFVDDAVSLHVEVDGTQPITYQWLHDDVEIPGANSSTWNRGTVALSDGGRYTARVTNAAGQKSATANLIVRSRVAPSFTLEPVSQTVLINSNTSFRALASGTPALSYRWRKDGVSLNDGTTISGAATPCLSLGPVLPASQGLYSVVVSNRAGSIESAPATLTVASPVPPIILTNPASAQRQVGATVTFSVSVLSAPPLSYQWRRNGRDIHAANGQFLLFASASSSSMPLPTRSF